MVTIDDDEPSRPSGLADLGESTFVLGSIVAVTSALIYLAWNFPDQRHDPDRELLIMLIGLGGLVGFAVCFKVLEVGPIVLWKVRDAIEARREAREPQHGSVHDEWLDGPGP